MTLTERVVRLSPFRWRLEWVLLVAAAASLVLSEQAREALQRDPYQLVRFGRTAQAAILAAREEVIPLGVRRGVQQQEVLRVVDLEWDDHAGMRRRVSDLPIDPQTAAVLDIDPRAGRWPQYVQILYLEHTEPRREQWQSGSSRLLPAPAAPARRACRPWVHCRLALLPPELLSPAEEAAGNVDYVLERAPYAFQMSLILLAVLLGLRAAGILDNRPSLE